MSQYTAPLKDMAFNLFDVWQVEKFWANNEILSEYLEADTAKAILEEAGKITAELIAPHAALADQTGVSLANGVVTTPAHYKDLFRQLADGGWTGLSGDPEYGGMGMPKSISTLFEEMMCSADIAFSLYSGLTSGACVALLQHADEATREFYLPKLYSGEWTATMCLTEPHAGSDLGIMRSQAQPLADGAYKITGTKIFITAGEHDLADNIIHLVLAKLPDAPAGSRGISLFLVPKYLPNAEGKPGVRNTVAVGSLEHKMGIHASATCVMNFDGATGYLIGEPNKGLACMFAMMNYERLAMGSQGLGASERAYQNALAYAKERLQGRVTEKDANKAEPIILLPDVRRMLLTVKALNEAGRTFSVYVANQLDQAKFGNDQQAQAIANLLTPITKAFMTDRGFESCVMAQQVFGGHGYIQEWGMEQLVRDVRIAQIYEGTNGIQALDFAMRKVAADGGKTLASLIASLAAQTNAVANPLLGKALHKYQQVVTEVLQSAVAVPNLLPTVAVEFLDATGYLLYGLMWQQTLNSLAGSCLSDQEQNSKRLTAQFYFDRVMPRLFSQLQLLQSSIKTVDEFPLDAF